MPGSAYPARRERRSHLSGNVTARNTLPDVRALRCGFGLAFAVASREHRVGRDCLITGGCTAGPMTPSRREDRAWCAELGRCGVEQDFAPRPRRAHRSAAARSTGRLVTPRSVYEVSPDTASMRFKSTSTRPRRSASAVVILGPTHLAGEHRHLAIGPDATTSGGAGPDCESDAAAPACAAALDVASMRR
jgi:hypothetical protein